MKSVTFSELGNNAKKYFDTVEQGEALEVFRHGKPVAILMPAGTRTRSPSREVAPLRIPGVSLARAILKEREVSKKIYRGEGERENTGAMAGSRGHLPEHSLRARGSVGVQQASSGKEA